MAAIASKNPFDALGNDIEDENDTPKAPMKEIVKKTTTSKKADVAPKAAAAAPADTRGPRRPRGDGNEAAFRDRNAGREYNRSRPTDESGAPRERGGRGRGGRGGGRGRQFERHSGTDRVDTDKQVSQGWGNDKNEWTEEQAGENLAKAEAAEDAPATTAEGEQPEAADEPAAEPEPEDKTKSFADYMAEREALGPIGGVLEVRQANEGARENKKWSAAKELVKDDDEEYFVGGKSKQKTAKERKEKAVVQINHEFVDPRSIRRGSGDRGRGGRGGGSRGDRPPRGGSGRGDYRGEYRGGRGGQRTGGSGGLNVADESAFPSLGGK